MASTWILGFPYLLINGAEEVEPLLRSRNINKSREYDLLRPWLADGLFTNNGDSWRSRRKILTPTFHSDILGPYAEVFRSRSCALFFLPAGSSINAAFDLGFGFGIRDQRSNRACSLVNSVS